MCPRQIALGMNVPPQEVSVLKSLDDYATIGNAIESTVLKKYRDNGQLYISQWKIPPKITGLGLNVGGVVDAILQINGELILIDVKTVGNVESYSYVTLEDNELKTLAAGEEITIKPEDERLKLTASKGAKETHLAQLQLYSAITGFDTVYIQLMSRRVQDTYSMDGLPSVKFHKVDVAQNILERRVAVVMYSQLCLERGYLPDKLHGIKKTTCSDAFCPFQDYCWKGATVNTDLSLIDEILSLELKKEALESAKTYVAKRYERNVLILPLLEQERAERLFNGGYL